MIVRRGGPHIIDHGPTPAPRHAKTAISGSIVVPASTKHRAWTPPPEKVKAYNATRPTTRAGRAR